MAAVSTLSGNTGGERMLSFFHTHTGDSLQVVYFRQGEYDHEAFAQLKVFLADWRDGKQHDLDPQLMDILWQLQQVTGSDNTWEVISAYRSPETNEMLRSRSSGVARNSQHLLGTAIDVRLRGWSLKCCVITPGVSSWAVWVIMQNRISYMSTQAGYDTGKVNHSGSVFNFNPREIP